MDLDWALVNRCRFLFATITLTIGTTLGYFLVQRAAESFRTGFLSRPLNIILALSLPIFWVALIINASQYPSMFSMDYIRVPQEWMPLFLLTTLTSIILSLFLIITNTKISFTRYWKVAVFEEEADHTIKTFFRCTEEALKNIQHCWIVK